MIGNTWIRSARASACANDVHAHATDAHPITRTLACALVGSAQASACAHGSIGSHDRTGGDAARRCLGAATPELRGHVEVRVEHTAQLSRLERMGRAVAHRDGHANRNRAHDRERPVRRHTNEGRVQARWHRHGMGRDIEQSVRIDRCREVANEGELGWKPARALHLEHGPQSDARHHDASAEGS